ncbi:hypothetical protein ANN_12902 [Periplaneta americana]|uniref:Uncharacterized protein n=1 Tax=Periplaneta americana TaxID=6978 RepID=A0ABQ8TK18_PERAM|nr:hypothetical protein ANN_12902 [Periplaneta americana]
MAGLCEGGNEPAGSLKAISVASWSKTPCPGLAQGKKFSHEISANHTIPPFWLDDRPPLLRTRAEPNYAASRAVSSLLVPHQVVGSATSVIREQCFRNGAARRRGAKLREWEGSAKQYSRDYRDVD